MIAGINAVKRLKGEQTVTLPQDTMIGALQRYISDSTIKDFQPMGANMGILPPLEEHIRDKKQRAAAYSERALASLEAVLSLL